MATNTDYAINNELVGIQYAGEPGCSDECRDAVIRLIQFGDQITLARILTCHGDHCFLLTINNIDLIAIKSGFGSGYNGAGSHAFACVLQLFEFHEVKIEEYDVGPEVIERLDNSSLTNLDIENINKSKPARPVRWYNYINSIYNGHVKSDNRNTLHKEFPPVIPFAIIDSRIVDLAKSFFDHPDENLLTGYRRLEDIVRKRTGIDQHGAKLFSKAFSEKEAKLIWDNLDKGEIEGRSMLFRGTFMAYRNPRAHRELQTSIDEQLAEFLLLNQLYLLEKESRAGNTASNF